MSFENVYRSREGVREIEKIANFIGKLVIKNEYEANLYETTSSLDSYHKYYLAYSKNDDFYNYSNADKKEYKYYVELQMTKKYTKEQFENLYKKDNDFLTKNVKYDIVKDLLNSLRVSRVYLYNEENTYYRQFLGLPNSDKDIIYLKNYDSEDPNAVVAAHLIKNDKYPATYSYYILQEHIKEVIEKYPDLTYLRFLNSNLSSFVLRQYPNYQIIQYDKGILNSNELNYFFKSYNKAKAQVILDYIHGFDSKQPLYNILMIQNLLYFTVLNYTNTYIEKFSLCDYSNENLDDILRSNGYDNLTKISDYNLKKKIVRNINDLISNKANNYVLELILNRIIETDLGLNELKRYYLEKEYNIDNKYSIDINTAKTLEHSIKLTFKEVPAISQGEFSSTSDDYKTYSEITEKDNLWGGINKTDSETIINNKKEKLKKEILSLNFNSILTRYISLTRTIDIIESQRNLRDYLYLMLTYFDMNDSNEFFNEKITFDTIECTPSALFAAMCWLQQMKYYEDHDIIIKDHCVINSSAVFRKYGTSTVEIDKFERRFIKNGVVTQEFDITPDILEWNVVDFMKNDDEISTIQVKRILNMEEVNPDGFKHIVKEKETTSDFFVVYRFYQNGIQLGEVTGSTTFEDLINDYNNQYPKLISRITEKLGKSYDFREYQAWLELLKLNKTDNSIYFIFKDCNRFSEYMNLVDSGSLVSWLAMKTDSTINPTKKDLQKVCETQEIVSRAFKEWVNTSFSKLVYKYDIEDTSSEYANDMIILFNEFLSVFSELYSIDYKYSLGLNEENQQRLQLFYNPVNMFIKDEYSDFIGLKYDNAISIYDFYKQQIELYYDSNINMSDSFEMALNKDLDINKQTNIFEYINSLKINDIFTELIKLQYEKDIKIKNELLKDTLNLNNFNYQLIEKKEIQVI